MSWLVSRKLHVGKTLEGKNALKLLDFNFFFSSFLPSYSGCLRSLTLSLKNQSFVFSKGDFKWDSKKWRLSSLLKNEQTVFWSRIEEDIYDLFNECPKTRFDRSGFVSPNRGEWGTRFPLTFNSNIRLSKSNVGLNNWRVFGIISKRFEGPNLKRGK